MSLIVTFFIFHLLSIFAYILLLVIHQNNCEGEYRRQHNEKSCGQEGKEEGGDKIKRDMVLFLHIYSCVLPLVVNVSSECKQVASDRMCDA